MSVHSQSRKQITSNHSTARWWGVAVTAQCISSCPAAACKWQKPMKRRDGECLFERESLPASLARGRVGSSGSRRAAEEEATVMTFLLTKTPLSSSKAALAANVSPPVKTFKKIQLKIDLAATPWGRQMIRVQVQAFQYKSKIGQVLRVQVQMHGTVETIF